MAALAAGTASGTKVQGHIQGDRDVISIDWLLECKKQGRLVPLRPRHYIHRSGSSLYVSTTLVFHIAPHLCRVAPLPPHAPSCRMCCLPIPCILLLCLQQDPLVDRMGDPYFLGELAGCLLLVVLRAQATLPYRRYPASALLPIYPTIAWH